MSGETLFWGGLEHFEFCPEGTDLEWHYGRELKNVGHSDNDHSDIENRVIKGLFWTYDYYVSNSAFYQWPTWGSYST